VTDRSAEAPDGDLVQRFLAGDAGAGTELITRHERRVYAVCLRVLGNPDDAADAAQDALVAMVRKLDGFRGEAAFTTWLYRVAMNVCYDHLRRARRQPMLRHATRNGSIRNNRSRPVRARISTSTAVTATAQPDRRTRLDCCSKPRSMPTGTSVCASRL